jgi:FAD dependent oxidoreductase TIGR03364
MPEIKHGKKSSAIVVGAGILGLATARALSLRGYNVTVIERSVRAVGASVRNFGMIWPVGQPSGVLYDRAIRSKMIWKEIAREARFWYEESGSLHLAYHKDEWKVLQELEAAFNKEGRGVKLLSPTEVHGITKDVVNPVNLLGGLYSNTEMIIDPREAIGLLPSWLEEKHGTHFIWGKSVTAVETGKVFMGRESLEADLICICSGADFESLYPEKFSQLSITKCKLQMMRFINPGKDNRIGASLCGGLSLVHYDSFKTASSLAALKERYRQELPEYIDNGIHVMVSQNGNGELTVGDSHHYGTTFSPFDEAKINQLIMDYLKTFAKTGHWQPVQSWHGIYPKMKDGSTEVFLQADEGVFILNGVGGAGMTLSFGLAEEIVGRL